MPAAADAGTNGLFAASRVLRHVPERVGLVGARLGRETEDALAEDVALHLLGATADADPPLAEEHLLPEPVLERVGAVRASPSAPSIASARSPFFATCSEIASLATELSGPIGFPARAAARARSPSHSQDLEARVRLGEPLTDVGIVGAAVVAGELDEVAEAEAHPAAADEHALGHQRRLGDAPAAVHLAEHVLVRDAHIRRGTSR